MSEPSDAVTTAIEKWTKLAAWWFDSTVAHAKAHCPPVAHAHHATRPGGEGKPHVEPSTASELGSVTMSEHLTCARSWTDVPGQVRITWVCSQDMQLQRASMRRVPAGGAVQAQSVPGDPSPYSVAAGASDVVVSIDPALERGLYLGSLRPTPSASGAANVARHVVIYLARLTSS